ncbi:hypothetical protein EG835_02930 [bacterium]|nr:hypothetical protein [bacterium]
MNGSLKFHPARSCARRPAILVGLCLLLLVSCTAVSNRVDRYESNYRYEYGAAEEADQQARKHPGVARCEDEYVAMGLAMRDFKFNMDFRIVNKTGGAVTVNWLSVLFELPKGQSTGAVPEGADATVVAAQGRSEARFAPEQTVSLFGIDSEETGVSGRTLYSDDRVVIRMPLRMEAIGQTKIYLFTYTYRPGIVELSGECTRLN